MTSSYASTAPGDVIDAHVHLFSVPLLEEYLEKTPEAPAAWREAVKQRKFGRRNGDLPELGAREMVDWYVKRLDDAGVAAAIVMSVFPDSEHMREVVAVGGQRLFALANIDPRSANAPESLSRELEAGFRGVKLLPVNRCYHLSDPAARPFFEKANELGIGIVVHYGVTVDPRGDLRYADPIDLSPVARDFPDVTFVIAHFGAGYLDQVLKVAYQCGNVCVDTSGTNNWIDHQVQFCTLEDVFRRSIQALGPERVLFGTDSGTTAKYRAWIKYQQMRILEVIGVSDADRDLVLRGNAVRIFGLEERG